MHNLILRKFAPALGLAALVPLLVVIAYGCGLLDFDLEEQIPERRVNGMAVTAILDAAGFFPPMNMGIDLDQEVSARDAGPADSVTIKSLTLKITSTAKSDAADVDNFDFLNALRIWIVGANGTNLPRVQLAVLDPVPEGLTTLDLPVDSSIDIKPYIEEGHTLESEIAGFPPPDDITYDGTIIVTVGF